jgi:pimeloyl-ACP methyl ester carboxylesterase
MSTYVFVHGAWHGAWCWHKVVPRLTKAGHTVFAPDLPSLGRDRTPVADVSLASWAESICRIVDAASEPVTLVGHSRGGIIISEVAERRPHKVAALVYLSAFLLRDGQSLLQVAQSHAGSLVLPNLVIAPDETSMTVKEDVLKEAFYGECSEEDVTLARMLLAPEPTAPAATPIHVTEARFGSVPRIYIECLRDRAIPLSLQRQMHASVPCHKVVAIDTDHSPFFSSPDALVDHLIVSGVVGAA